MSGLLSIPCSNADSERVFFLMLRKIHTDQRATLDHSTIVSLMGRKYNCDECCTEVELDHQLLAKCKKATLSSLNKGKTLSYKKFHLFSFTIIPSSSMLNTYQISGSGL